MGLIGTRKMKQSVQFTQTGIGWNGSICAINRWALCIGLLSWLKGFLSTFTDVDRPFTGKSESSSALSHHDNCCFGCSWRCAWVWFCGIALDAAMEKGWDEGQSGVKLFLRRHLLILSLQLGVVVPVRWPTWSTRQVDPVGCDVELPWFRLILISHFLLLPQSPHHNCRHHFHFF